MNVGDGMEGLLCNDGHKVCCGVHLARPLASRTHHEVIQLRGSSHELRPTHSHTDLHKACVLAGFGLSHLTHDPMEGKEIAHEPHDFQLRPTAEPRKLTCVSSAREPELRSDLRFSSRF